MTIQEFDLVSVPKVTLHEHIEGTVTPELAAKLAKRHKQDLPSDFVRKDGSYNYNTFMEFINTYDVVAALMRTPEDYYDVTKDYLSRTAKDGGIYAELTLSPAHMSIDKNGKLDPKRHHDMMDAMTDALADIERECSLVTRFVVTGVRNLGVENVEQVAKFIGDHPHPLITGFNLAGDEINFPALQFKNAFEIAAKNGLGLTAHAGEVRGAESVQSAMDNLKVTRIGHGVRITEDPNVLEDAIKRGIVFEVCPTSNKILVPEYKNSYTGHPVRKLYDAGISITINPDDAGIFGTDCGQEHRVAQDVFGFSKAEFYDIAFTGIKAAFVDEKTKESLMKRVIKSIDNDTLNAIKDIAADNTNRAISKRFGDWTRMIGAAK